MADNYGKVPSWDLVSKHRKKQKDDGDEWKVVAALGSSKPQTPPQPPRKTPPKAGPSRPPVQNASPARGRANVARTRTSPEKFKTLLGRTNANQPRRPPPKLNSDADNEAETAWRGHQKPQDTIRIQSDIALHDKTYETIARSNGTFIQVVEVPSRETGGSVTLGIWGDANDVANAKQAIRHWLEASMTSKAAVGKSLTSKLRSLTVKESEVQEKRWRAEVAKHKFRQNPLPNMVFEAMGSFHWPVEEYRPDEVFGASYEALDPIRTAHSCYITFDKDRGMFKVMGKQNNVQAALLLIRRTRFQIEVRQLRTLRAYLLHWPYANNYPSHVFLQTYVLPIPLGVKDDRVQESFAPQGDGYADDFGSDMETCMSEEHVQQSLLKVLRKLHYYRGNIQVRIRLGTFLATQYKELKDGEMYELEKYKTMIGMSQFSGRVTQE